MTGTIVKVGEGQWATADGQPPVDEHGVVDPFLSALQVYQVLDVQIDGTAKSPVGDDRFEAGSVIRLRAFGGTIGCHRFQIAGDLRYVSDDQVALFLGDQAGLDSAPRADLDVIDAWPIIDGIVHGRDGQVSVDDLLAEANQPQ